MRELDSFKGFVANSAVFSWWHLSGVLSEPGNPPPPLRQKSSLLYFNQTKYVWLAEQLIMLRPAAYILPHTTTTPTSTSIFQFFNF